MNHKMVSITLYLKPWKGKISKIVFVSLIKEGKTVEDAVNFKISQLRKQCIYKRRTVIGYSLILNEKL